MAAGGFTLVELLVVITIIGILIALLLPAVQSARESARQLQCRNNLKQLALACLSHEQTYQRFPTGGWGFAWTGDADQGADQKQPAGWIYNILPFLEQQAMHDMGAGLSPWNNPQKLTANSQRMMVPLPMLNCPTRRNTILYTWAQYWQPANVSGRPTIVTRSDYAANGGDLYTDPSYYWNNPWNSYPVNAAAGPSTLEGGLTAQAVVHFGNIAAHASGIVHCGSLIALCDITDGTSNTYLMGEKQVGADYYATGQDGGDNESALAGNNQDIERWTTNSNYYWPIADPSGYWTYGLAFGSAHSVGFQAALCDGSVHMVSYDIDHETHRCLGNRRDGSTVDGKTL
jgi:prepilin-type N-terminal cleavage/methylation domain-containing protein